MKNKGWEEIWFMIPGLGICCVLLLPQNYTELIWNSRMLRLQNKSSVCRINSAEHAGDTNQEVTAPQFLDKMAVGTSDGKVHQMAVGTSDGKVLVYDLGSSHPTRVEDHMRVILW
ncbi:uncharacterized protein LOC113274854 isoform X3 [Papaver somniferum]|uniref:uncharacterized protein LOC113274854 isoform X3 n=1 Tax=Papaver somniferum TaxID=3469 RepID=UPI000E6FBB8A|nr:uncharacterized protein LOC113274854 isoform X3 [Papaver somniferum]XP_026380048.1 uncharacterized protein LOC113274854 isoform X3 [Papaver somniferum]XP_026380049.1 uncharacterized protein LOC113274854 isoform X3 [Papaver somniferum]